MKKILVVEVNWLGDAILTTPVFKALKEKYPCSYTGVMAVERIRGVFEGNPYIDEVIVFDEKGAQKNILEKIKFINFLRKKRFDAVFLIHRSFTRAAICFFAGIKTRIGYKRKKGFFTLTERIAVPTGSIHRQDYYLRLFEKTGINIKDRMPQFFIPRGIGDKVCVDLAPIKQKYAYLVGINPSANWPLKRWPAGYFAKLCDCLIKDCNCGVIFIGAEQEKPLIEEIIGQTQGKVYDFCGKTTLKELAALIENMNLFISNDSGPAHLSASLGIKTLVIFGPTADAVTSPKGRYVKVLKKSVECEIPCYKLSCKDNICMKKIKVNDVFFEAKKMLADEPC